MNLPKAFVYLTLILMVGTISFAQNSVTTCTDNITAQVNISITVDGITSNITQAVTCQFGCDNRTDGINECRPDPTEPTLFVLVPPIVLFFAAFLLLYIGINIKEYLPLQFLFLGSALFLIIANVWFAQSEAVRTLSHANDVLAVVYQGMIVVMLIVVIYFILSIIRTAVKDTQSKSRGELE